MKLTVSKKGLRLHYRRGRKCYVFNISKCLLMLLITVTLLWVFVRGITSIVSDFNRTKSTVNKKEDTYSFEFKAPKIEEIKDEEVKEEEQTLLVDDSTTNDEAPVIQETETVQQEIIKVPEGLQYRLTHYYMGDSTDSGATTASGKSISDFQVNDRGWYTYDGKLVVATASKRLLSWDRYKDSTQPTYDLYEELTLEIDGQSYDAIVLDVCGAAMREPRIDLFVQDKNSGIDANIIVRRK